MNRPITAVIQAWGADVTYIRTAAYFVYLAGQLNLFSRKAIGYVVSQSLHASSTLEALAGLCLKGTRQGCIHHSDKGIQYAC
jgi:putative transposase